jgi:hypothetical protein
MTVRVILLPSRIVDHLCVLDPIAGGKGTGIYPSPYEWAVIARSICTGRKREIDSLKK